MIGMGKWAPHHGVLTEQSREDAFNNAMRASQSRGMFPDKVYEVRDKSGNVIGHMTMDEFTKWAAGNRAALKNYKLH